ncbi:helix-turn-helix transcriptional regulator [Paenibacillus sp. IB182496]|uniref:Helix-turn-helix transcriptional regulator n=1 Tax=Paenibacillus sabuli TaxID=2772509 RepID=A0A927BTE8_9BACL|nr:helix-turn-helix transcriptional regulator [Paenibacillus sabuli]MBD2845571.1 helix-turn-helix transcriptional regulator [Paenibacillus sabuli]
MDALSKIIGNKIRALRKSKGLTQDNLSDVTGLDYRYIGAVERGEINFTMKTFEKILTSLDVPLHNVANQLTTDPSHPHAHIEEWEQLIAGLSDEQIASLLHALKELRKALE